MESGSNFYFTIGNNFKCFDNINLLELEFLENASRRRVFFWVHAVSLDGFLELSKIMAVVRYSESSGDINDNDGNNNNNNFKNSCTLYIH